MRFLVVDDSPTMRRILCNTLNEIGYDDLDEAEDGAQALTKLTSEKFDFLITDWNMPNMNGLELTKTVRADANLGEMPILMVTTRGMKDDVLAAMQAKVSNYVVKPFTAEILRQKIDMVLQNC